ncbi:Aste57867_20199 [Aphanomyces stellatus]|uniref:Aste57867_20199 protein n=1 Tax=Aphanomyces stellatus TaxID=120398 RepID=A0A485LFN5_9STRA|nr:hypothetical protein As57867_020133 [Aphanomyces stellatus]VFT96893.1 Aste57867_20199 [Aphanomyces stellatus]
MPRLHTALLLLALALGCANGQSVDTNHSTFQGMATLQLSLLNMSGSQATDTSTAPPTATTIESKTESESSLTPAPPTMATPDTPSPPTISPAPTSLLTTSPTLTPTTTSSPTPSSGTPTPAPPTLSPPTTTSSPSTTDPSTPLPSTTTASPTTAPTTTIPTTTTEPTTSSVPQTSSPKPSTSATPETPSPTFPPAPATTSTTSAPPATTPPATSGPLTLPPTDTNSTSTVPVPATTSSSPLSPPLTAEPNSTASPPDATDTPRLTLTVVTSLPFFIPPSPNQTLSAVLKSIIANATDAPASVIDALVDISASPATTTSPSPHQHAPSALSSTSDSLAANDVAQTAAPRPALTPRGDVPAAAAVDVAVLHDGTPASVSGAETPKTETNRYIFSVLVGITLAFLAFFHYMAIAPSFVTPDTYVARLVAPNSWELPTVVSFLQCVTLGSFANVNAPHAILVAFTDAMSWLSFLVPATTTPSATAPSISTSQLVDHLNNPTRHLVDASVSSWYDPFGIQQFALRVHVLERDLFVRAWTCFFVLVALLMVVAIAAATVARLAQAGTPYGNHTTAGSTHMRAKQFSRHVVGFTIVLGMVAVLPLAMVSTYELMQDITSHAGFGVMGFVATCALVVLAGAILGAACVLSHMTEVDLTKYKTKVTFGVLYVNLQFDHRLFVAISLLVQFLTGVFVAMAPKSQLLFLLVLHSVYLALMVGLRPFVTTLQASVSIFLEVVVLVIFGLVYAMQQAAFDDVNTKRSLGFTHVIIVCVILVLVFVRNVVKLWSYVTGWAKEKETKMKELVPRHATPGRKVVAADPFAVEVVGSTTSIDDCHSLLSTKCSFELDKHNPM